MPAPAPINLCDHPADELHRQLAGLGVTAGLARRIQASVWRRGALPVERTDISPRLLAAVAEASHLPRLTLLERTVSPRDGFAKYLFRGAGAQPFEAVRIPLLHRAADPKYVVCVSSQVGCAMGCVFCRTGQMGFMRHLAPWEIVDQVRFIRDDSAHPVRGVVFMGMGEPLLNYKAVIRAARIMAESSGLAIAAKAITISTVGIVPMIRRFTAERHPFRLIVSLTSADPVERARLLPIEAHFPTSELLAALREYHAATGLRVTLAWTMISGVNTRPLDAEQLAALVQDLPIKLDLIDVNDPTGRLLPPTPAELATFRDALRTHLAAPVARRYSGGSDILAACGLLATPVFPATPGSTALGAALAAAEE